MPTQLFAINTVHILKAVNNNYCHAFQLREHYEILRKRKKVTELFLPHPQGILITNTRMHDNV